MSANVIEFPMTDNGAIIATVTNHDHRNVVGTHSGSYAIGRALDEHGLSE